MSEYSNQSQSGADYEWHYEYYDDEEPVSFEGLRANRYSIVIGFWVGLAVFVIFMFFVLTLLTKTGALHPEIPDPSEKHHGLADCVLELGGSQALSLPPLPDESRSLFHFYIHEETVRDTVIGRGRCCGRGPGLHLQGAAEDERGDEDEHFLSDFHIPNFVSSEQNSSVGNDDFLPCEPSIITDSQSAALKSLEPAHTSYDVIRH
ncbi:melanocortin-2 receptor accessory protein 2B [Sinocyclocheilus grahami]|uniref:Melanocortin-2 receptor accessory protein 2B-like n=1 Tax=Sinocyclocheilus grahami TaxID=75366 RepID=A0A672NPN6_SINGR|nr:PREDICTED: melanocortin-2 receptor accessory protein 2B-like [Sinocyclocheilus grahami]